MGEAWKELNIPFAFTLATIFFCIGDWFHKLALQCGDATTKSFGHERGSQEIDVQSAMQLLLDIAYYMRKERGNVLARLMAFNGSYVNIAKNVKKQRWELLALAAAYAMYLGTTKSQSQADMTLAPDFFIQEIQKYTKTQYQFRLLSRAIAGFLDPYTWVVWSMYVSVHAVFWKWALYVSRQAYPNRIQGCCTPEVLDHFYHELAPAWDAAVKSPMSSLPQVNEAIGNLRCYARYRVLERTEEEQEGDEGRGDIMFTSLEEAEAAGLTDSKPRPRRYKQYERLLDVGVCVALEKEKQRISGGVASPRDIDVGGGRYANLRSMQVMDRESGDVYDLERTEHVVTHSDGAESMGVSELADLAEKQAAEGMRAGKASNGKWGAEFCHPPHVISFLMVTTKNGPCARWLLHLMLRLRPTLLSQVIDLDAIDMKPFEPHSRTSDKFFDQLFDQQLSGDIPKEQLEMQTVDLVERCGLFHTRKLVDEMIKLSYDMTKDRTTDAVPTSFATEYPRLNEQLLGTVLTLGPSNYVCEQANGMMDAKTNINDSLILQQAKVSW